MYLNLLPQSFQRDLVIRQRFLQWSLIWASVAVALLLWCGWESLLVMHQHSVLAEAELRCLPTRELQGRTNQVEQQLAAARAEQGHLEELLTDHRALATLALVSRAVQGTSGRVHVQNLQFHCPHDYPSLRTEKTPAPARQGHLHLQGIAADDEAIAAFIDALRHVPVVVHAELKSSSHWTAAGSDERKFEIVCKL